MQTTAPATLTFYGRVVVLLVAVVLANSHIHRHHTHAHHDEVPEARAELHEHELEEDDEGNILCRHCGQKITSRDMLVKRKTHKALGTRTDPDLGKTGSFELQKFRNPQAIEFEVATFSSADAGTLDHSSDEPTATASFFPPYKWRAIECSHCRSFLGWQFSRPANSKTDVRAKPKANPSSKVETRVLSEAEQEAALAHLDSVCLTHADGWWSYRWCHKKEVRQFHIEPKQDKPTQDWSLGDFDAVGRKQRTNQVHIGRNMRKRPFISHFFLGGQVCHENKKRRSTEVRFQCCDEHRPSKTERGRRKDRKAIFLSIGEKALCQYELYICVPKLCDVFQVSPPVPVETREASDDTFVALVWDNVVAEDSQDLRFAQNLKFITALDR